MNTLVTQSVQGFKVTKTDGKTIFHRVPIFAECARGDLSFGAAWIAGAVAQAKQQERDGYLPPLHTRHHEPETAQTNAVQAVGVFRIVDASPLSFKGTRITAIFADLIVTDEWAAEEIERMKYPYRSVEIFDPEGDPKINGLALLDHEAPYLELPMLFAGEIEDKRVNGNDSSNTSVGVASAITPTFSLNYADNPNNPVLWSARRGNSAYLLFKFPDEESMSNTTQSKKPAKSTNFADDDKAADDDKKENMEGDEGEGGGSTMDVGAVVTAIESGSISIADMDALLVAIQAQSTAPETEEEGEGDDAAPALAPGAEIMKGGSSAANNFARMQGENDVLKARLDARDASDTRRDAVGVAMKRLEGKPLGSDLEGKLTKFHDLVGGNAVAFKEYVDTMASMAGDLPPDADGKNFSSHPKTPKSAMAFQALGHEAVDKATQFARQYPQIKGLRASEDSYVRTNMKALGFEIEETTTA